MPELARIEKLSIFEVGKESKKLLEIPLIFYSSSIRFSLPAEYDTKVNQFYNILIDWINQLSENIGKVNRIYIESVTKAGKEAYLQVIQILAKNKRLLGIIEEFLELGAQLEKTEDADILAEYIAWVDDANSPDALEIDKKYILETKMERMNFISKKIQESLKENEIAIFFVSFDLEPIMEYPQEVKVIKFRPPVIDDILKFLK